MHSKQTVKGGGEHWKFPLCTTVLKFEIFEFVRIDKMVAYSENYLLELSLAILIFWEYKHRTHTYFLYYLQMTTKFGES